MVTIMKIRFCGSLALLCVLFLSLGCSNEPKRYRLYGTVSYKGNPVKIGTISFFPEGSTAPGGGGAINEGKYDIPAAAGLLAGKYKVSISAPTTKGAEAGGDAPGMSGETKETLPAKYNSATTLTVEVGPGKPEEVPFNLD